VCKFLKSSLDELDGTKTEPAFAITAAIAGVPTCKANPLKPALKQVIKIIILLYFIIIIKRIFVMNIEFFSV